LFILILELCHQLTASEAFAGKPKQPQIDQPDHQSYEQDNAQAEVHHALAPRGLIDQRYSSRRGAAKVRRFE
jgi:hypothetical protein